MANLFKSIPKPKLKRNTFNLSHEVKLTTDMGRLTPIICEPVVPGDTWKMSTEILIRVAPLLAPVMHRVNVYTHFFFVPNRLIWSNWQKFITGGENGREEPSYPKIEITQDDYDGEFDTSSLADYLGFPTPTASTGTNPITGDHVFDALPFRAYQLIYNEYYRDENLCPEVDIKKDVDGLITDADYLADLTSIKYRAWEKDYFTSALPWTQKGDETTIGLSGNAPVTTPVGSLEGRRQPMYLHNSKDNGDTGLGYGAKTNLQLNGASVPPTGSTVSEYGTFGNMVQGNWHEYYPTNLYADLSQVNATTINELRRAIQLQQYKEVLARSGNRYIELIRGLFGVVSSDARLQRPEFLGGGKTELQFGEVLQTSETTQSSPLANMAGRGVSYGKSHSFKRFFEEHGYIIGILSVMPKPAYQQGLPRKYYKFDRLDHYIPQFANIGEQNILNQELYYNYGVDQTPSHANNATFGYTPRYAEYKYLPSEVHGDFKTNLDFWHMGREFIATPLLNQSFITMSPDEVSRVYAVTDSSYDKLWCMLYHNIKATRPMPKFGVPLI